MKVNEAYYQLLQNDRRYLALKGGAGAGKSVFIAQKIIHRITSEEGHRILIIRKVRATLRSSCYQLIKDILESENLLSRIEINKSELRFTDRINKNEILMCGIDDPEKLKSFTGITSAWIEEATELEEWEFIRVDLLLRGETKNYKQLILSFNPIDERHWIKKRFFDTIDSDIQIFHSTYKDNAFIDEAYKKMLEDRLSKDENMYRIYVKGEWGLLKRGGEFYKNFSMSKQIVELKYNSYLPLHISFDFNVNPYMTLEIAHLQGNRLSYVNEICPFHPLNTTRSTCREFKKQYPNHDTGLFIYGDPAGKHQDTRSEKGHNDFKIIEQELEQYHPHFRIMSQAPSIVMRGDFINTIFASNLDDIEILIDPKCKNLINDLCYMKEDKEGKKHKEVIRDKEAGISYEKYSHTSDAMDYMICEIFKENYRRFQQGTKKSIYRVGQVAKPRGF